MKTPHEDTLRQMLERIQNVLTTINKYRAMDLENARLETMQSQLELVEERVRAGEGFTYKELSDLDFSLIEHTPLEGNESLVRELYSIRNFIEHL